jgi:hypothetical protein
LPSTLTVLNTNDSGPGSLRAEIAAAQSGDTIVFDPSLAGRMINLTGGELAIRQSLTIQGTAGNPEVINAFGVSRIFHITGSVNVTLANLEIAGGGGSASGAGLYNTGTATLNNCFFFSNSAVGNRKAEVNGGAIENLGTMTVTNSRFLENLASDQGGAIDNRGTLTVSGSSLNGDQAAIDSGGEISNYGVLTVTSTTFGPFPVSGAPVNEGGAIANFGSALLDSCTIFSQSASFGGGVFNAGNMTVTNTTISDCFAAINGGAIDNTGTLTLSACIISASPHADTGNGAFSAGGGIYNTGTLYITNGSTVTGNTAPAGADLYNLGTLFISSDSTVDVIGP